MCHSTTLPHTNGFRHRFLQKQIFTMWGGWGGALFISGIEVQCVSVSEHVWLGGSGLGVGWGYQPGVYVPLKTLFLVGSLLQLGSTVLEAIT